MFKKKHVDYWLARNRSKYPEKTNLSVLEQGYPSLKHIIIDSGRR